MHQTVGNVLRVLLYSNPLQNLTQTRDIVDQALATAMHAMQVMTATTLGSMLGALAFSHIMFLNVPLIADCHAIAQCHEQYVNDNLCHTNRKQRQHDYAPGQKVLKKMHDLAKLGVRTTGPYNIEQAHVNGVLTIASRYHRMLQHMECHPVSSMNVGAFHMLEPISASLSKDKGHHLVH